MRFEVRNRPENTTNREFGVSAGFSMGYEDSKNLKKNELFSLEHPSNSNKNNTFQTLVSGCPAMGYRLTNGPKCVIFIVEIRERY